VAEIARRYRERVDIFEKAIPRSEPLRGSIRQAVNQTPAVKKHQKKHQKD